MSSYPKAGLPLAVALFALAVLNLLFTPSVIAAASTVIDATKAGVIGDGATLNSASIQKAIDDCAAGGGGTAEDATIQLPEKESGYPENGMFGKTLPAYGIYARHVRGVAFKNIEVKTRKPDARPERVFINVESAAHSSRKRPDPAQT